VTQERMYWLAQCLMHTQILVQTSICNQPANSRIERLKKHVERSGMGLAGKWA